MPEAKTDPAPAASAPAKSGNKLILMVGLGLLLATGGAGGAWFALGGKSKGHDAEAKVEEKKPAKKPARTRRAPRKKAAAAAASAAAPDAAEVAAPAKRPRARAKKKAE